MVKIALRLAVLPSTRSSCFGARDRGVYTLDRAAGR
jgi:hypothetical protein